MTPEILKSPYVYFGAKGTIIADVWTRLGKCDTFVDPFFGSGVSILANPYPDTTVETVNDLNNYIANFWRAVAADPQAVAHHADYPVSEIDLHVRHVWLVSEGARIIKQCEYDADFYDVKVAGWWVWGMALWIGSGFCAGNGAWDYDMLRAASELGTYDLRALRAARPDLARAANGVDRKRPHLADAGKGVKRQRPDLGSAGKGVSRKFDNGLLGYIQQLSNRFRRVRVCCGDWQRVLQPAVTWAGADGTNQSTCGIFLDPPYSSAANRDMSCYGQYDDGDVAHAVRAWCIENGDNPLMRVALCGYVDEGHDELVERGWSVLEWKAAGGYSTFSAQKQSKLNRARERIWFSPACKPPAPRLFA
jgi:hypothetical protein